MAHPWLLGCVETASIVSHRHCKPLLRERNENFDVARRTMDERILHGFLHDHEQPRAVTAHAWRLLPLAAYLYNALPVRHPRCSITEKAQERIWAFFCFLESPQDGTEAGLGMFQRLLGVRELQEYGVSIAGDVYRRREAKAHTGQELLHIIVQIIGDAPAVGGD